MSQAMFLPFFFVRSKSHVDCVLWFSTTMLWWLKLGPLGWCLEEVGKRGRCVIMLDHARSCQKLSVAKPAFLLICPAAT